MWTPLVSVVVVLAALIPNAPTRAIATKTGTYQLAAVQFQPREVVSSSTGGEVFVLGFKSCSTRSCSSPELWAGTGASFVQRAAPSGTTQLYLSQLVFANGLDGYALGTKLGTFATTNGGISWTRVSVGRDMRVFNLVASDGWFYAVTAHCVTAKKLAPTCTDYRLARSLVGSLLWSSIPIPGTSEMASSHLTYVDVTAWGREVSVSVPWFTQRGLGQTILRSFEGLAPLRVAGRSKWSSTLGASELIASSSSSIWEIGPTGMEQAFLYSNDAGGHFRLFWQDAGTTLDPVSGGVAYRYTADYLLPRSLQGELALTTNGGASFIAVDHLAVLQMAFVNRWDGYVVGATNAQGNNPDLLQTSDGGRSWHKVVPEIATQ